MMITRALIAALIVLVVPSLSFAQMPAKILQVKDIQPGTKGIGFTVFKGVEPEPFDVIIGDPIRQAEYYRILARVSGGPMETPLEKLGGVSGMSGSPIFTDCSNFDECVKTGTLVGALSYNIGSFLEGGMNVLLTPAEYMLGSRFSGYIMKSQLSHKRSREISVGNLKANDLMMYSEGQADPAGQPGITACTSLPKSNIKPGSYVTIYLMKGDIAYGASGTVTWRDGEKIYLFGHPFFGTGIVNYPFSQVSVAGTLQTPLQARKITGCELEEKGALLVDGFFEIAGAIGREVPTVPFQLDLVMGNKMTSLNEEIIPSPIANELVTSLSKDWINRILGDVSGTAVSYRARITIADEPEIFLKNTAPVLGDVPGGYSSFDIAFTDLNKALSRLYAGGFEYVLESIRMTISPAGELSAWRKKDVYLSKTRARPGETVDLNIVLENSSGRQEFRNITIPITIPADFKDRVFIGAPKMDIVIKDGARFVAPGIPDAPAEIDQVIRRINEEMNRGTNRLYIQKTLPSKKKTAGDVSKTNAKEPNKWNSINSGDLRNLEASTNLEVQLEATPPLDHFIDFDSSFSILIDLSESVSQTEQVSRKSLYKFWTWF